MDGKKLDISKPIDYTQDFDLFSLAMGAEFKF